jgi:hypothetical protein
MKGYFVRCKKWNYLQIFRPNTAVIISGLIGQLLLTSVLSSELPTKSQGPRDVNNNNNSSWSGIDTVVSNPGFGGGGGLKLVRYRYCGLQSWFRGGGGRMAKDVGNLQGKMASKTIAKKN